MAGWHAFSPRLSSDGPYFKMLSLAPSTRSQLASLVRWLLVEVKESQPAGFNLFQQSHFTRVPAFKSCRRRRRLQKQLRIRNTSTFIYARTYRRRPTISCSLAQLAINEICHLHVALLTPLPRSRRIPGRVRRRVNLSAQESIASRSRKARAGK